VASGPRGEVPLSVAAYMRIADGPRPDLCVVEGVVTAMGGETLALSDHAVDRTGGPRHHSGASASPDVSGQGGPDTPLAA